MAVRLTEATRRKLAAMMAIPMSGRLRSMVDSGDARIVGEVALVDAGFAALARGHAYRVGDGDVQAEIIGERAGMAIGLTGIVEGRRIGVGFERISPVEAGGTMGPMQLAIDPVEPEAEPETWRDRPALF